MKHFFQYIILFLFLLSTHFLIAQDRDQKVDSLKTQIKNAKQDTVKVKQLVALSVIYHEEYQFDSARVFANKAKELAIRINFEFGLGVAYERIGLSYDYQGEFDLSRENYNKALEIYKKLDNQVKQASVLNNTATTYFYESNYIKAASLYQEALKIHTENNNEYCMSSCHNNLGAIYNIQGDYTKAINEYYAALKLYERSKNKTDARYAHNNIGTIHLNQHDYDNALKQFERALELAKEINDKAFIANSYHNIALVYSRLEQFSKSRKESMKALNIYQEIDDKRTAATVLANIGVTYESENDLSKALEYYTSAFEIRQEIDDVRGITYSYLQLGDTYIAMKRMSEGRNYLQKGLEMALELGIKHVIKGIFEALYVADSIQGNYQSAFHNYKMYSIYKDSLFNEETTKELTRAGMQFEFDKKIFADSLKQVEKDQVMQAKLDKQKAYTWSGSGIALLLIIFSIFIVRNNKILAFERKRSDDLLLNILPEEVSQELKEKGRTTANHYDNVTVLFTDFVGFTKVSEQMDSQELVDELHACFKAFDEIISKYNIEKIKTIGDAYMAVSGLPQSVENHAKNIVNAALEIRDFMQKRKLEKGEHSFNIRLGVHSGSVVAGVVGVKKFAYDIWGDTVNTAARMEQNSEKNKVNISATTHELIKDEFQFEYRGKIEAKNKGELEMYFVEHRN